MPKTENKPTEAIATTGWDKLQEGRPSFLQGQEVRGLEMVTGKDITIPRLSLCQSNTPQRKKADPKYIEGLEEGMFFNSLTGKVYGEVLKIVPLFFYKSRIYFKDLDEGGGIICQAPGPDGMKCQLNNGGPCLHNQWSIKGDPPDCNEFFNYPSLVLPERDLLVVSLKSTGIKAAKDWNMMMRKRKADIFAGIYEVKSKPARNKANLDYYAYEVNNAGWVDEDLWREAGNMYDMVSEGISTGKMTADDSGLAAEQSAASEM